MNPASASLLPLHDLGQVPSPAWVSGSRPDNQSLAAMISRTPPSPDVVPPTFLQSPLGSHQGLLLPPRLSPLLPRVPFLPWLDSQGFLATWHGPWQDGSVFPGVPRVKGRARGCPCRPSVCLLLDSVGGSTSLWGPQGAMQGGSWIPLLEEEREGATSRCGPSGGPSGFC